MGSWKHSHSLPLETREVIGYALFSPISTATRNGQGLDLDPIDIETALV